MVRDKSGYNKNFSDYNGNNTSNLVNKSKMKYTNFPYVLDVVFKGRVEDDCNILSLMDWPSHILRKGWTMKSIHGDDVGIKSLDLSILCFKSI